MLPVRRESAFVVPAATDGSPRDRRASSFAKPEESVPDVDGLPSTALSTSSIQAQATAVTAGQGIGASTPHSTSPSSLPAPTGPRSPTSSDAMPTPVPPALQTAQVLQRMDKAEIRIGLQSTTLAPSGCIPRWPTIKWALPSAPLTLAYATPCWSKRLRWRKRLPGTACAWIRSVLTPALPNSNFNSFGSNERQPSRQKAERDRAVASPGNRHAAPLRRVGGRKLPARRSRLKEVIDDH